MISNSALCDLTAPTPAVINHPQHTCVCTRHRCTCTSLCSHKRTHTHTYTCTLTYTHSNHDRSLLPVVPCYIVSSHWPVFGRGTSLSFYLLGPLSPDLTGFLKCPLSRHLWGLPAPHWAGALGEYSPGPRRQCEGPSVSARG